MPSKQGAAAQLRAILPDAEFEQQLLTQLEATEAAVKGQAGLIPLLVVIEAKTPERFMVTVLALPVLDDDRHAMLRQLGGVLQRRGFCPLGLVLVTEAWTKSMNPAQAEAFRRAKQQVSAYEDKQEVVIAAGLTIDQRVSVFTRAIERDEQGLIRGLGPVEPLQQAQLPVVEAVYEGYFAAVQAAQEGRPNG